MVEPKRKDERERDGFARCTGGGCAGKVLFRIVLSAVVVATAAAFLIPWLFEYLSDGFTIHEPARRALVRSVLWETPQPVALPRAGEEDAGDAAAEREADTVEEEAASRCHRPPETYEPTLSGDGLTMIFTCGKARHNADLFISLRSAQGWTGAEPLTAVNSDRDELGPELSRDGRTLYFYSDREGGLGGYDIWVSRRGGDGWTQPENLGPGVNSEYNEYGPGLPPDESRLYFASNRPRKALTRKEKEAWQATLRENFHGSDYDIFGAVADVADVTGIVPGPEGASLPEPPGEGRPSDPPPFRRFRAATRVDALNSPADEGQVAMTPRGDFLYFSSNREGGHGSFDLYRSRVVDGRIEPPENLGAPVNSPQNDMDPSLTLEGHGLLFSSNRGTLFSSNRETSGGLRPYRIYRTVSREVFSETDLSALAALLRALDAIKWPLLLWILGLLALLWLLRLLRSHRFRMYSSLLQRCLLLSLLIHLILAFLLSTWIVGGALYDMAGEDSGTLFIDTDSLAGERIGLEIREQISDLEQLAGAEPLDSPVPLPAAAEAPLSPETREVTFEPVDPALLFAPEPVAVMLPEPKTAIESPSHASALEELLLPPSSDALETPSPAAPEEAPRLTAFSNQEITERKELAPATPLAPAALPDRLEPGPASAASPSPLAVARLDSAPPEEELAPAESGARRAETQESLESSAAAAPRVTMDAPSAGPPEKSESPEPIAGPSPRTRKVALPRRDSVPELPETDRVGVAAEHPARTAIPAPAPEREPSPLAAIPPDELSRHRVEPHPVQTGPAPLPEEPMERFRRAESTERSERSRTERQTDHPSPRVRDERSLARQIPLEGRRDTPSIAPLPLPPPPERSTDPVPLALDDRSRSPAAEESALSRYEHGTPRTYHGLEMKSRRVVFCIDISGSMEWNNRIGEARRELLRLLETLDEAVEFNIIAFSGRVRVWSGSGLLPGDERNVESARRFVRGSRIASDGTNTVGALTAALADEKVDSIYFLSDGHPTMGFTTDSDEILQTVREHQRRRNVVIHTIAYIKGDPPPQYRSDVPPKRRLIDLMQQLAEQNDGHFLLCDE